MTLRRPAPEIRGRARIAAVVALLSVGGTVAALAARDADQTLEQARGEAGDAAAASA